MYEAPPRESATAHKPGSTSGPIDHDHERAPASTDNDPIEPSAAGTGSRR
jgi:hypothetical protein